MFALLICTTRGAIGARSSCTTRPCAILHGNQVGIREVEGESRRIGCDYAGYISLRVEDLDDLMCCLNDTWVTRNARSGVEARSWTTGADALNFAMNHQ